VQTLERPHRAPAQALPPHAADCHMHVFGPFDRFPLAAERAYNVPPAPLEAHERMKKQVGLERTVFVQGSGHGTDNRAMLAALGAIGSRGRGVAVVAPQTPLAELQKLHKAGVRGLRLNLYTFAARHKGEPGDLLRTYERLIAPLGWHLQLFCSPDTLMALAPHIPRASVPIVIDHMGLPDAAQGLDQPAFQTMLDLVSKGAWAKVAGADRITQKTGRLDDALPFIRALAAAAPQRLVWGSDWPNIGFHNREPVTDDSHILEHRELDAGGLLDLLARAVPDAAVRGAILAGNPENLYGFSTSS
jgi:2-pyrone-4,6-dicarboxylate lactonase